MLHSAECTASVSHATSAPLCDAVCTSQSEAQYRTPSHHSVECARHSAMQSARHRVKCALHFVTQYIHRVPAPRLGDWVTVRIPTQFARYWVNWVVKLGRDTCRVAAVRGDWVFHVSGSTCLLRKEPIAKDFSGQPGHHRFCRESLFAGADARQRYGD